MARAKIIKLIVEENDGLLEGYISGLKSNSLISASGKNENELIKNLKELITDYQQNEGINDKEYQSINVDKVKFDVVYNISSFFTAHSYLKSSAIAELAKINTQLMSQYVKGRKHPGIKQVKKIKDAVHKIGKELTQVQFA